jgi:hypothetical protein
MVTLWNPADETQNLVFTLFFAGGSYRYPVPLGPRATRTFNVSEIIQNQLPDENGNTIPAGVHEGSAEIAGIQAEQEHILVAMAAGTYNVRKATCAGNCTTCGGYTGVDEFDFLDGSIPVGSTTTVTYSLLNNSGTYVNVSNSSTWSSSNSGIATVNTPGTVGGVAAGSFTAYATTSYQPEYDKFVCPTGDSINCPEKEFSTSGPGTIQLPNSLEVLNVTVLPNGQGLNFGCSGLANYGIRVDIKYQVLDQNGKPILSANMIPHEHGVFFGGGGYDNNIGPTGFANSTLTTAADGTFHDVPLGVCANGAFSSLSDAQFITIIMPDGSAPSVRGQTFTATGQSAGHGTLSNSVGDISATR